MCAPFGAPFSQTFERLEALFDMFWCTLRGAPFGALFACCAAPCNNFDMATLGLTGVTPVFMYLLNIICPPVNYLRRSMLNIRFYIC